MRASDRSDHCFCVELLPSVSRTFALSIEALPDELRDAVRVSYLLCRIVDTVEDGEGLGLTDRFRLFAAFDDALADDTREVAPFERLSAELMREVDPIERRLCTGAGAVFRIFRALPAEQQQAIRPHVQEMSRGMQEYVLRAAEGTAVGLASMADLERYCFYVAGTVGELLTALFFQLMPELDPPTRSALEQRAVSFGLGLQMVNVVKDAAADFARGVCFLPRRVGEAKAPLPDDLLDPVERDRGLSIIRAVCARAREHLQRAQEYTELWPVPAGLPVRLFCTVPLALALATLDEVEAGTDTLRAGRSPKVSRSVVARLLRDAQAAVSSNEALDALFGRRLVDLDSLQP